MLLRLNALTRDSLFVPDTSTPSEVSRTESACTCKFGEAREATLEWKHDGQRAAVKLDRAACERLFFVIDKTTAFVTNDLEEALRLHVASGASTTIVPDPIPYGNAPFEDLRSLGHGERAELVFRAGRWEVLKFAEHDGREASMASSINVRARLFANARRLAPTRSDIPVLLSGGLDSAVTLACLAADFTPRLVAVHLRLPEALRSFEQPLARATAAHLGVRYDELQLRSADLASDKALASHSFFFNWSGLRDQIQLYLASIGPVAFWGVRAEIFQGSIDGLVPSPTELLQWGPGAVRARWGIRRAASLARGTRRPRASVGAIFERILWPGLAYGYANTSVGPTVRSLSLFADPDLIAYARRTYPSLGAIDKLVLREAFSEDLPDSVRTHPRVGTPSFPGRWFGGEQQSARRLAATAMLARLRRECQEPKPPSVPVVGLPPVS